MTRYVTFNGPSQKLDSYKKDYSDWIIFLVHLNIFVYIALSLLILQRLLHAAILLDRVLHVDGFKGELKLDNHLLSRSTIH